MSEQNNPWPRRIVIGINVFFLICALAIFISGIYAIVETTSLIETAPVLGNLPLYSLAVIITVVGAVFLVISAIGIYGAYQEAKTMVWIYIFFLAIITIAQLSVGIALFVLGGSVGETLDQYVAPSWADDMTDQNRNDYQKMFSCCGFKNITDNIGTNCEPEWDVSCRQATINFVDVAIVPVGSACIALGVIELITLLAALIMGCQKKEDNYYFGGTFGTGTFGQYQ